MHKRKEYDKALSCYVKALKIKIKNIGEIHTSVASSYHNIGLVWKNKGNLEKALENFLKSLNIRLKTIGNKHQNLVNTYYNIGLIYKEQKKFEDSIINLELGFEISSNDSFLYRIAECFEAIYERKKALVYYIKCAEIRKQKIELENEVTKKVIANAKRLAKELDRESELPEWMK